MTSQLLTPANSSVTSGSTAALSDGSSSTSPASTNTRWVELTKSLYKAHHQVEFFHLQAEADALLQQLQLISQQRLASST